MFGIYPLQKLLGAICGKVSFQEFGQLLRRNTIDAI